MPSDLTDRQLRIREDLTAAISGEVRVGPLDRALYACDASLYQITPEAIAYPSSHDDVETLLAYAAANELPVTCRGSGTGVAGGCLGSGLILDFSRSMRRVLEIDPVARTARVEAGIVRDELNRRLQPHGLYLAPDPANSPITTVGSMVAVDAAGSHRPRFGSMRDHVRGLRGVLAGGQRFDATHATFETPTESDIGSALKSRLAKLLGPRATRIAESFAGRPAAACGYALDRALQSDGSVDVTQLLCGSEGTLAAVTEVELALRPLAGGRCALMVVFRRVEEAIQAAIAIRDLQPDACDLLDRRLLGVARGAESRFGDIIPNDAECALLIDILADSREEAVERMNTLRGTLRDAYPAARFVFEAQTLEESTFLWTLPGRVLPLLTRLSGGVRPLPIVEDLLVPTDRLLEFLPRARRVFQRHDATASLQSHVLTGQLHLRPLLPIPTTPDRRQQLESIARDLYEIVFDLGGTLSGEHGDGLSRTAFLRSRFGSLFPVLREVKQAFDPGWRLNRDKVISDSPHLTIEHLRTNPRKPPDVGLQLLWPTVPSVDGSQAASDEESPVALHPFAAEANRCTGCGECRRIDLGTRMCPVLALDRLEDNSPRSKANAARALMEGTIDEEMFGSPEIKDLAERCFNCKQCQVDCPTHVDIPHLMIEAKAAAYGQRGLSRVNWLLSRAHSFGGLATPLAPLINAGTSSPPVRWLLEKLIGLAQQRKLPRFAARSFTRSLRSDRIETPGATRDVVYFVDHYANYHDVELARCTVAVLQHQGFNVVVPRDQLPSGMAMISAGDLESAREVAATNLDVLGPLAAEGLPIVCSEPTAVLALRDDYSRLVEHPEGAAVAERTHELGAFLLQLKREGKLKTDFTGVPASLLYHTPCHLLALGPERPLLELLRDVPDLTIESVERGCSGMAGAYGLSRLHYRDSIRIGRQLIRTVRQMSHEGTTTECSGCKMQMEQATPRPSVHPIKLLAQAYRLLPTSRELLEPAKRRLVVT